MGFPWAELRGAALFPINLFFPCLIMYKGIKRKGISDEVHFLQVFMMGVGPDRAIVVMEPPPVPNRECEPL